MKPMLKADFFAAIKSLLKNGFKPRFRTTNVGKIGLIEFTGNDDSNQVEQVYSCNSYSTERMAARYQGWMDQIMADHHAAIAEDMQRDEKVLVGAKIFTVQTFRTTFTRSINGTPRSQTCPRTGVIVLNNGAEVMAGDVIRLGPDREPTDEENALADILNGMQSKADEEGACGTPDGMPMSKADFQALVEKVRAAGCTPRVEWGYVFKWSHLCWTAADGSEQRRALYQTSPGSAYLMRRRYENWLRDSLPVKE